jgi:hypothetical protein
MRVIPSVLISPRPCFQIIRDRCLVSKTVIHRDEYKGLWQKPKLL